MMYRHSVFFILLILKKLWLFFESVVSAAGRKYLLKISTVSG